MGLWEMMASPAQRHALRLLRLRDRPNLSRRRSEEKLYDGTNGGNTKAYELMPGHDMKIGRRKLPLRNSPHTNKWATGYSDHKGGNPARIYIIGRGFTNPSGQPPDYSVTGFPHDRRLHDIHSSEMSPMRTRSSILDPHSLLRTHPPSILYPYLDPPCPLCRRSS